MKTHIQIAVIIIIAGSFTYALDYRWPLPQASDKYSSGTFCEYRYSTNEAKRHFHEGIDIPATGTYVVSSATNWFKCIEIGDLNGDTYGKYVTIQHYKDSLTPVEEGSRYLHLNIVNPDLVEDSIYSNTPISKGTSFVDNHLHFEMREPAPVRLDNKNSFNPFAYYSLTDVTAPYLDYLYVDGSTDHQGDATINSWNFLGYDFMEYYDSTTVWPFIRLTLPAETRDNDLDDPHILISGNRKVRFILKAKDQVSIGYSEDCAPYGISLYADTALASGSADPPIIEDMTPFYEVRFDSLLKSSDEVHNEEDVYHTESPLVSTNSIFYYRLYPIDVNLDGYPSCILSGRWTVLKTEDLEEGHHRIRIVAKDYYGNVKTADAHFYIRRNDWVDYSRAFSD